MAHSAPTPTLPVAALSRRFTPKFEAAMAAHFEVRPSPDDRIMHPGALIDHGSGADYLVVSPTEHVTADVFAALAPNLRAVATLSVGLDHIDLAAARDYRIPILHTPDVLTDACADIALLLILAASRRAHEANAMVRSGAWPGWAPTQLLGVGLQGRRLGIFGMGRIGGAVATRARAFGLQINYHNRRRLDPALEAGATYFADLERFLSASDILCVCAAGGADTRGLFSAKAFAQLPAGAVFVNIARGDMVEDDALIAALASGHIAAAGLDVFAGEPQIDPRYASLPNVFLTPHIGSATLETRDAMGFLLLDGLLALRRGDRPSNLADKAYA